MHLLLEIDVYLNMYKTSSWYT